MVASAIFQNCRFVLVKDDVLSFCSQSTISTKHPINSEKIQALLSYLNAQPELVEQCYQAWKAATNTVIDKPVLIFATTPSNYDNAFKQPQKFKKANKTVRC
jgi:hypothetical protein